MAWFCWCWSRPLRNKPYLNSEAAREPPVKAGSRDGDWGCYRSWRRPSSYEATHRVIKLKPLWDTVFSRCNYFYRSCLSVQRRNVFQHLPSTHNFRLAEYIESCSDHRAGYDCSYPYCSSFNTCSSHFVPKLGSKHQITLLSSKTLLKDMT